MIASFWCGPFLAVRIFLGCCDYIHPPHFAQIIPVWLQVEWRDDKVMMPEPAPFHELFAPSLGQFDIDDVELIQRHLKSAPVFNGRLVR
jgi:hypothetical protein